MKQCQQENEEMAAGLNNEERSDDATPSPEKIQKKTIAADKSTREAAIAEVTEEGSTEQADKGTAEQPDEVDQISAPRRSSSRVHVQASNQAIAEVVEKQKEAEAKAKDLQEQLVTCQTY